MQSVRRQDRKIARCVLNANSKQSGATLDGTRISLHIFMYRLSITMVLVSVDKQ